MNLDELSVDFAKCRSFGHRWKPYTAKKDRKGFAVVLICDCCGTMKHFHITKKGERDVAPIFSYAEGYLRRKGDPFLTHSDRDQIRLIALELL